MAGEPEDKKTYNISVKIKVMKQFKKMCIDSGVSVSSEVERLMVRRMIEDAEEKGPSKAK